MEHLKHTRASTSLEEALTVLFCLVDDVCQNINPNGRRYESMKKLSDSEVITLALFQQLRGLESQRSFLRDAERFFLHLFPGVAGLHPSFLVPSARGEATAFPGVYAARGGGRAGG
jgi:hypothetical protein